MSVDPMHDDELGVGKGIVMHILRLLQAQGGGATEEFDARSVLSKTTTALTPLIASSFRQVPTFGRDTIRKFGGSVSSLKKKTARGFEDIMQVSLCHPFPEERGSNTLTVLDTCPRGFASRTTQRANPRSCF